MYIYICKHIYVHIQWIHVDIRTCYWCSYLQSSHLPKPTLPETNIAPENGWLGDEMSFWYTLFSGAMLVSGRVFTTNPPSFPPAISSSARQCPTIPSIARRWCWKGCLPWRFSAFLASAGEKPPSNGLAPWLFGIYVGDEILPDYEEDGTFGSPTKSGEQCKKARKVVWDICRGWNTTQLYRDYFISRES